MFTDLSDFIYRLEPANVKASPSVNSPNDGRFNSEENARWANKKLTTKPFIYGRTEEEVASSFGSNISMGWYGAYNSDATINIDGYLIRLADPDSVSYDSPNMYPGPDINFMPAQNFISGLINSGTQYELSPIYSDFLFSTYDPSQNTITDSFRELWTDAIDGHTIVGFAKNTYIDSYLDALTVNLVQQKISYGSKTIPATLTQDKTPDDLSEQTEPIGRIVEDGNNNVTRVDIYYPVYAVKSKTYSLTDKQYKDTVKITFSDIFGINYVFQTVYSNTHGYPYTFNNYMDMDNNAPVTALGTVQCDPTTFPEKFYNFMELYDTTQNPIARKDFDTAISPYGSDAFPTTLVSNVFDVYTQSQLQEYVPAVVTDIPSIKNELSYYCIKLNEQMQNLCLTVTNANSQIKKIPVSFMSSNGTITPEGFITGGQISTKYPVEGYMHFVRRLYVLATNPGYSFSSPTEDEIKAVTLQNLVSWTQESSLPTNGTSETQSVSVSFTQLYQTYIYPCICFYFNLSYNSLMDNVVYGVQTNYMKACGAGFAVKGKSGTTEVDTVIKQAYNLSGYNNNGGTLEPYTWTVDVEYHKDFIPDYDRIHFNTLDIVQSGNENFAPGYDYMGEFSWDTTSPNYFEDPINLIRRCMTTSSVDSVSTASGSTIYYVISGNTLVAQTIYGAEAKIKIDPLLFPEVSTYQTVSPTDSKAVSPNVLISSMQTMTKIMYNGSGNSKTFGNGVSYSVRQNSWIVELPYIAELQKDSKNYLSGRSYLDGKYNGVKFRFLMNLDELTDEQLLLFLYMGSSNPGVHSQDYESFNLGVDYLDEKVKTLREAFLHVSKIYGDGNIPLTQVIQNMVDDSADTIMEDVSQVETKVDACRRLLYSGELRTINSFEHIYYEIFGFDMNDNSKVCEIFTKGNSAGSIGAYSSPFDPQSDPEDLSPLIGKGISVINVHPGIKNIQSYVFSFNFDVLNLPFTISRIEPYACSGSASTLSGPVYVNFAQGIRLLDGYCFRYSRVSEIFIPSTVASGLGTTDSNYYLGSAQSAFVDCTNLSRITFDCHDVGTTVCENCVALYDVTITQNVKHLYPYAFTGCTDYLTINYLGTKQQFLDLRKDAHWGSLDINDTKYVHTICCVDYYATYDLDTDDYIWYEYPVE